MNAVHHFDTIAALHVLRRWAVEQIENGRGVTVLSPDHALQSFYREHGTEDNWMAFYSGTFGQYERKSSREAVLRAINESIAIVVSTEVHVRSTE